MSFDWKTEIARIAYWRQVAAEHDELHALPWHLPRVGASPAEIRKAQETANFNFPAEYSEFLMFANGWKGFFVSTDLYGTSDFLSGRFRSTLESPELRAFLARMGIDARQALTVGSSDFD